MSLGRRDLTARDPLHRADADAMLETAVRIGTGKQLFGSNEQDGGYDCVEELRKRRTQAKSGPSPGRVQG